VVVDIILCTLPFDAQNVLGSYGIGFKKQAGKKRGGLVVDQCKMGVPTDLQTVKKACEMKTGTMTLANGY